MALSALRPLHGLNNQAEEVLIHMIFSYQAYAKHGK